MKISAKLTKLFLYSEKGSREVNTHRKPHKRDGTYNLDHQILNISKEEKLDGMYIVYRLSIIFLINKK